MRLKGRRKVVDTVRTTKTVTLTKDTWVAFSVNLNSPVADASRCYIEMLSEPQNLSGLSGFSIAWGLNSAGDKVDFWACSEVTTASFNLNIGFRVIQVTGKVEHVLASVTPSGGVYDLTLTTTVNPDQCELIRCGRVSHKAQAGTAPGYGHELVFYNSSTVRLYNSANAARWVGFAVVRP